VDGVLPVHGDGSVHAVVELREDANDLHHLTGHYLARDTGVLANGRIVAAVESLPPPIRADWDAIRDLAAKSSDPKHEALRSYLVRIRNGVAFHYYEPKALHKGYRYFFFKRERDDLNRFAMYSSGPSMQSMRFYFADAAAQGVQLELDPDNTMTVQLEGISEQVSDALRWLVVHYFSAKLPPPNAEEDS
jgi:hypothetical protein